ncbi:MAG: nucleoside-diphosphate sugar epimerase [Erythrobacter sp. RIFCSPHIGHO2_12_FULL_63_10]|nr:MAG: nucleoside-diphosphate sugar epimerase [Erythrobacter sp. RIFCSPHIGHO2_12_FULL_63_10]
MSEVLRIVLIGSTGLVGRKLIDACIGRGNVRLIAVARREVKLPQGARIELVVADPKDWGEVIAGIAPDVLINALGTTWKQAGKDEAAFRAVDQQLVINAARAAQRAGVRQLVSVSSVGADARSKKFYLRVKGEVEKELSTVGFKRLDVMRPGLLRGARIDDSRPIEAIAQAIAPLVDPFLIGKWRPYRSVSAEMVAQAALGLAMRKAPGRFTHDYEGIRRAKREWIKVKE